MPTDDESKILPPMMNDRARPQANRTLLGVLLALLAVAVILALWFLIFDSDGTSSSASDPVARPTPLTLPTSTPAPADGIAVTTTDDAIVAPTPTPVVAPTPVPPGFEACTAEASPLTTASYLVDTNTSPLNQRSEPSVNGTQLGSFPPAKTGLIFTGECLVNLDDGFTWWKIFNGTEDVWVASNFVTPE